MASRTRQAPPWPTGRRTTGKRRPVSGAGARGLRHVADNARRGWKKTLRKHPAVGVAASVLLGVVAVLALLAGVILESFLYYLVMALSGLGALAIRRAQMMARQRHQAPPPRARPTGAGPRPPKPAAGSEGPAASSGPPKCTETGQPVGECDCASRHVATAEGARRYGVPVGSPIGRRKKAPKPQATV